MQESNKGKENVAPHVARQLHLVV